MKTLRPNVQRSKNAIIFIWIVLVLELILCVSNYFQLNLLQSISDGGYISPSEADANDNRQLIIAVLYTIVVTISAVTFIQWFRRAYFNLHILVKGLSNTEGWAAGAWFVPFLNLFRPYQIMSEMSKKTKELVSKHELNSSFSNISSSNIIGIWWALWVISGIGNRISYKLPLDTVEEMIRSTNFEMYSIIIQLPLALITVKLIKDHSELESLLVNLPNKESTENTNSVLSETEL